MIRQRLEPKVVLVYDFIAFRVFFFVYNASWFYCTAAADLIFFATSKGETWCG